MATTKSAPKVSKVEANGNGAAQAAPKPQPTTLEALEAKGKELRVALDKATEVLRACEAEVKTATKKSKPTAERSLARARAEFDQVNAAYLATRREFAALKEEQTSANRKAAAEKRNQWYNSLKEWRPLEKPLVGKDVSTWADKLVLAASVQGTGGVYEVLEDPKDGRCWVVIHWGFGATCKACKSAGYKSLGLTHRKDQTFDSWMDALSAVVWQVQRELAEDATAKPKAVETAAK